VTIYLDCHSTTPVDERVLAAMMPYLREEFGNAASKTHLVGHRAAAAVEEAREGVAKAIRADADEIVFTSGATESDNLAILGVLRASSKKHVVTVSTEHKAVLDACRAAQAEGAKVTVVGVDAEGLVKPADIEEAITPETAVVSVMHANNEIGVIQPIAEIGALCRSRGVYFHSDAAQSYGKVPIDVQAMSVDLLSISAHKIYGPKGIGALYVRKLRPRVKIEPLIHGGGHEKGLRSGTLNVPGAVGLGRAVEIAVAEMGTEQARVKSLRERLRRGIFERLDAVILNGSLEQRLAGNLNVTFEFVEGEALTMLLSDEGIAVSTGSACSSAVLEPSHVLRALGRTEPQVAGSIRFGLGRFTTEAEVDRALDVLVASVKKLRAMSPLYKG
jgi:cysteine desulfurase